MSYSSLITQLNASELAAITADYINKTPLISDLHTKSPILLFKLWGGSIKMDARENVVEPQNLDAKGKFCRQFIEYQGANQQYFGPGSTINRAAKRQLTSANFLYGGCASSQSITYEDLLENNNDLALVNLVQQRLKAIRKGLPDIIAQNLYLSRSDTTDSLGVDGLGDLFNTNTSTAYGSLTEAAYSDWCANVITDADEIGIVSLQKMRRKAMIGNTAQGGEIPDIYLTSLAIVDSYQAQLSTQAQDVKVNDLINAGYHAMAFGGAGVVPDLLLPTAQAAVGSDANVSYVYGLNTPRLFLKTSPAVPGTMPNWDKDNAASDPFTWTASSIWAGWFMTNHRKAHVLHTKMSVAS